MQSNDTYLILLIFFIDNCMSYAMVSLLMGSIGSYVLNLIF